MTTLIPMPLVVFSGAQENANNGMGISVVICDFKVVSEFFVIHTRDVSFYFNFTNRFACFYGHLKVKLEVFKESFQFAFNFHFCQVNSREADFFFSIGRQRIFVFFEILSMYLCRRKKAGSLVAVSKCSITLGGRLNLPLGSDWRPRRICASLWRAP